ncbi:MAG TPA: transaldolase, partial [Planctomycetaceae bacterium]|nr:transaldolase [Planctomycetaceae bacterium]
ALGATGATSNPVIVSNLIKTGRFDDRIEQLIANGLDDHDLAWQLTDQLVQEAQAVFLPVWRATGGNDGYVSFELDPLLEDPQTNLTHAERVEQYVTLGKRWSQGQQNRMIKVPATAAGLVAMEALSAAGVTLNVTLIFTQDQYRAARDAIWRGAQRRDSLESFKSVYSIFISRVDVYTAQHIPALSPAAQGMVGIVNAKRMWHENRTFWENQSCPLAQEMVFASTGTKNPEDAPWKYVAALAGSDIQTNPPATNDAVEQSGMTLPRTVDQMPDEAVLRDIDTHVVETQMHDVLMQEGIQKFVAPQKALLDLIAAKRAAVASR